MPQRFWTFFNLPAVLLNPYNRTPHHDLCSCNLMFCPLNVQVWSPDYQRRGLQQPVSGPGAWSFSPADAPGLPEGKIHLSSFSDIILAVLLCSMSLTACCLCCSGDRLGLQVWLRCQHIWPAVHLCEPSQVSDITSNCGPLTLKDLLNYTHTHTHTHTLYFSFISWFSCLFFFLCLLPVYRVLMLHLKRFSFTPFLQLEKLRYPVELFRELLVTSSQVRNNSPESKYKVNMWSVCTGVLYVCVVDCVPPQADGWYSLVSVISHLGSGGEQGKMMTRWHHTVTFCGSSISFSDSLFEHFC